MPTPSFATDIVRALYGLDSVSAEALNQHAYDGRGIFRICDMQGGLWVLRLKRGAEEHEALTHTARLLEWFAQREYSAPVVRRTHEQRLVPQPKNVTRHHSHSLRAAWAMVLVRSCSTLQRGSGRNTQLLQQWIGAWHCQQKVATLYTAAPHW
jgi:hypothetical protein